MADNVIIDGVAPGAFTDGMSGLPPWATENTLLDIKRILKAGATTGASLAAGGMPTGGLAALIATLGGNTKALKDSNNRRKKAAAARDEREKLFGRSLQTFADKLLFVSATLKQFGEAIQKTFADNIRTYAALQQGGINLTAGFENTASGFNSLQQITALTGVRFTELSATMLKYSSAVNVFTAGKFAKTVGMAAKGLEEFGYSSKESAELLGSYLESQSKYSDVRNQTEEQTSASLKLFGQRITKLSMITGVARQTILSNIEAISKSTEASVLAAQSGAEAANATTTWLGSLKDQNFGKILLKMMTDQIKPLNTTFQSFQKIGLGGFGQKFMAFTNSLKTMDPKVRNQAIREFYETNANEINNGLKQSNFLSQIPELAGAAGESAAALTALQQTAFQTAKDEEEANKPANKARSKLASNWERLMSSMQKAFGPPLLAVEALGDMLGWLADGVDSVINFFNSFGAETTGWIGVVGMAAGALGGLVLSFKTLTGLLSLFGKSLPKLITGPIGLLGKAFKGLGSGLSWLVKGVLSTLGKPIALLGSSFLRLVSAVGWLYTAWEVGQKFGEMLYEVVKSMNWFTDMMDTIFSALDRILQYMPGQIGRDAKERIETREKVKAAAEANVKPAVSPDTAEAKQAAAALTAMAAKAKVETPANSAVASGNNTPKATEISIPKEPTPTTIDSPSSKPEVNTRNTAAKEPGETQVTTAAIPAITQPASGADINNIMMRSNALLEQLLHSTNNVATINRDILKFTRAQA